MYVGVDGGGSKTKVIVVNDNLEKVCFMEYGSLHFMQVGEVGIEEIICDIRKNVRADVSIVLGIPMYGEVSEVDLIIDKVVGKYFSNAIIVNDVFNGWAGSLGCKNGVNVVSGTGSISICVEDDTSTIVGGFGHIFGDEGSAYWIGRKTLSVYSKQLDGRLDKTRLFDLISRTEFSNLNFGFNCSRDEIAKYAIICNEAADESCNFCVDILQEAAYELSLLVSRFDKNLPVSYSGSVFNSTIIKDCFINNLQGYNIQEPKLNPVLGSVLYAYVKLNENVDVLYAIEKLKVIEC